VRSHAPIACLGAGRMGRGIAVVFAYAGHRVCLVDFKARAAADFARLRDEAIGEVRGTLRMLAQFGLFPPAMAEVITARVSIVPLTKAQPALAKSAIIFEGVPEVLDVKRDALARASKLAGPRPVIASTTSTILVDELSSAVASPERFLNAHWLNPAFLIPLVELSPGRSTDPGIVARLKRLLEAVGKVPIVCAARPGYIVPRIQSLAMNEAARMVEEGIASAADIDKAIKYGFGIRYAVLGMLEFIDWGGGDILYYASRYLTGALGDARYAAPDIIERNMREGRVGLKTGQGFLDYAALDIEAYRRERLAAFVALLRHLGLTRPPALPSRVTRKRPATRPRARPPSRRR
jgi:3-hydroxybutyryl-CoA dehydrogenase